jgi:hypothetical protein
MHILGTVSSAKTPGLQISKRCVTFDARCQHRSTDEVHIVTAKGIRCPTQTKHSTENSETVSSLAVRQLICTFASSLFHPCPCDNENSVRP